MTPVVSASTLLTGAVLALEQGGRLLEDAAILFDRSRFATAAGLALLAREEIGRHRILLDRWRRTFGGEAFTPTEITRACDDHVTKQRHGQLGVTIRADSDSQIGRCFYVATLEARVAKLRATVTTLSSDVESACHTNANDQRLRAFYVDLRVDGSGWSRPIPLIRSLACIPSKTPSMTTPSRETGSNMRKLSTGSRSLQQLSRACRMPWRWRCRLVCQPS